jgi:four helix bundle protein
MQENKRPKYDLEERTAKFGENKIEFCKKLPKNVITIPLISQLIKSATSIGANYFEADCAESRKDFEHKIGISKKESGETKYWLRMIASSIPEFEKEAMKHRQEASELCLIFIAIIKNSRANGLK